MTRPRDYALALISGLTAAAPWLLMAILCTTAAAPTASAAPLNVTIEGPKQVAPGDLAVFKSAGDPAAEYRWLIAGSDRTLFVDSTGIAAAFSSGTPGVYTVILAAAKGDAVSLAQHTLTVGTPPPPPPPIPPPPPPTPGPEGLAKTVAQWVVALAIEPTARAKQAAALAESFQNVATAAAAGTIATREQFRDMAIEANAKALAAAGGTAAAWQPFTAALNTTLTELQAKGELNTVAQLGETWSKIAAGLRGSQPTKGK